MFYDFVCLVVNSYNIYLVIIVIFVHVLDSYKKAIRKCNIAKSKSDLSSSAEEPAFKKKMRKQRKASISESNSGKYK